MTDRPSGEPDPAASGPSERWPIFICYRRIDGGAAAARIHAVLDGRTVTTPDGLAYALDPYLDTAMPGVSDWTAEHRPYLERARAFILIATPGAKLREGDDDWVHREIDWWVANRSTAAPILVDPVGGGERYVPDAIGARWPDIQRIDLHAEGWEGLDATEAERKDTDLRERIVGALLPSQAAVYSQELEEERRRSDRLRKSTRRLRWSLGAAVLLLIVSVAATLGTIAFGQRTADAEQALRQTELARQEAEVARTEAELQARIAEVLRLGSQSVAETEERPALSLLLAVEAQKAARELSVSEGWEARRALLTGLSADPLLSARLRSDLITVSSDGTQTSVSALAVAPGGAYVAAGFVDGAILIWDTSTGKPIGGAVDGHDTWVYSMVFQPDGSSLLSAGRDGLILRWDLSVDPPVGREVGRHGTRDVVLAFHPEGTTFASGGGGRTVKIWDAQTWDERRELVGHEFRVTALAYSDDGRLLASADDFGRVRIWTPDERPRNWGEIEGRRGANPTTIALAFDRSADRLAAVDDDGDVRLWSVDREGRSARLLGRGKSNDSQRSVAFTDGGQFLTAGSDGSLWEFQLSWYDRSTRGPGRAQAIVNDGDLMLPADSRFNQEPVVFDGDWIAYSSIGDTGTVIVRHFSDRAPLGEPLTDAGPRARSVAFHPSANVVASGHALGLRLLRVPDGSVTAEPLDSGIKGQGLGIRDLAFHPDGRQLVSVDDDGKLWRWGISLAPLAAERLGRIGGDDDPPSLSVAFHPSGSQFATGDREGNVRIWSVDGGDLESIPVLTSTSNVAALDPSDPRPEIADLAFDPSGERLAVVNRFPPDLDSSAVLGGFKVLRLSPGPPTLEPQLFGDSVGRISSVAFHPDRTVVATDGSHGVQLLRRDTGTLVGPLADERLLPGGWASSLSFNADGTILAAADGFDDVFLWDTRARTWSSMSCDRANRNLTLLEWRAFFPERKYAKSCPDLPTGDGADDIASSGIE